MCCDQEVDEEKEEAKLGYEKFSLCVGLRAHMGKLTTTLLPPQFPYHATNLQTLILYRKYMYDAYVYMCAYT